MKLTAAADYLYNLGHETLTMKLGLANILALTEQLGRPDRAYPIVHVAGTNGKGSFCAMLAAILQAARLPAGLFTSPHLISLTERLQFQLTAISADQFCSLLDQIKTAVDQLLANGALPARPTFFEHITALALCYFRDCAARLAILEVGLGGRLDSTNIVTPILSVINRIDLDHQQYLGNTLAEIAAEKAGILKPGVPALIAPQSEVAAQVIKARAAEIDTKLHWLDPARLSYHQQADGYWRFDLISDRHHYRNLPVNLRGRHQVATAALAVLAAEQLIEQGFQINERDIVEGLATAQWPGRLEVIEPVIEQQPTILLDGAHNPDGIATLCDFLNSWLPERKFSARVLIFSAMRDKDLLGMARQLFPLFDQVLLIGRADARAADFTELKKQLRDQLPNQSAKLTLCSGAAAGLAAAREAVAADGLIVAAGSLHLIGELKQII